MNITNKPKKNSRVSSVAEHGDIYFELRSIQNIDEPCAVHEHRLGMTRTTLRISIESARALAQQLNYHVVNNDLNK